MNLKKVRQLISFIFADSEDFSLENRLFISTVIFGVLICIIGTAMSLLVSPSLITIGMCIGFGVMLVILYYFIRFKGLIEPFKLPVIIVALLGISTIWVNDGGMNGPDLMVAFVILMLSLIGVSETKKIFIALFFLFLVVSIYLVQFYRPDLIVMIPSITARWADSLVTAIYCTIFIYLIISFIHRQYNIEKGRAEENERKFKSLSENSEDYIIRFDRKHRQIYTNRAWFKISGHSSSELLGKSIGDTGFFTKEQAELWEKIIEKVFITKQPHTEQFSRESSNGTIYLDCRLFPELDRFNEVSSVLGVLRDITDIKQSELKLLHLNADKDRFISILAHDLKSPFSSILGFLDLLTRNVQVYDKEKIFSQLNIINDSAKQHYNLLEDLLVWTRSNSGKLPFEAVKLNLNSICRDSIEALILKANYKNIEVDLLVPPDVTIWADSGMLKTIIRNLVSNAIKFNHAGGKIEITALDAGQEVIITVADNGIGIEAGRLHKLFESNTLSTTSGTDNESGTGLGLLICKEFVDKHGGRLWAVSEEGKGSEFKFSLPSKSS